MIREGLLLGIAVAASVVLLNHHVLYLTEGFALRPTPLLSYILVTAVTYLFLRFVVIAIELRPPRGHAELVRCPECGQWLDDPSASALEAHRRVELTPRPTRREVESALALRRAVDAARRGVQKPSGRLEGRKPAVRAGSGDLQRLDLIAALDDPDFLERERHAPRARHGPREKG